MMQSIFSWVDEHYDKIAVEEAILNSAEISGTVLRLPMVYGPGDPLHRFFPLLKRFDDGRSSILFADDLAAWRGPRGYVENIAHAIALAATSKQAAGRVLQPLPGTHVVRAGMAEEDRDTGTLVGRVCCTAQEKNANTSVAAG
jgi:nucleoside-diphosphate-sugar epimerase